MARCGCTPKCTCVFTDGVCTRAAFVSQSETMVSVLSDGQTVFCDGGVLEARLNTLDTNTVDLSGDGTAGNPLMADVILTPDANVPDPNALGTGNLIKEGAPGIYVSCEDVQDCVGAAIEVVASDCLEYDDATNTIQILICGEPNGVECIAAGGPGCPTGGLAVFPSSDVGNSLAFGTDDRLYQPATAIIPGDCMMFTGTGTAADPFVITPLIAPEPNGVECVPGSGLLVTPSSDANNGLVFGTDTRLFINRCPFVAGGSQVLIGNTGPCFELVGGDDCVTPMLATLRISDDVCQGLECRADGLFVLVDPTNVPAPTELTTQFGPFGPFNGSSGNNGIVVEGPTCITITNPSTCRNMVTTAFLSGFADVGRTSGEIVARFDISNAGPGGPWFTVSQVGQANATPPSRWTASASWHGDEVIIGPGGTRELCSRMVVFTNVLNNGRVFNGERTIRLIGRWTTE